MALHEKRKSATCLDLELSKTAQEACNAVFRIGSDIDRLVETAHESAFARFTGVVDALGWLTPKTSAGETPAVTPAEPSSIVLASAQATLDNQLVTLYASLPARTALIILTGRSDPRRMASLNARNSTFESAIRDGKKAEDIDKADWWTASDGQELKEESEEGEKGTVVFGKQVKG